MKRRWRLLVCVALFLLVVAAGLHSDVHWRLIGWVRAEAFYQRRPTSWWAHEIQQNYYYFYQESGNHSGPTLHRPPTFFAAA